MIFNCSWLSGRGHVDSKKNESASYYQRNREALRSRAKHWRRHDVPRAILEDARKSDRKRKRDNDLDLTFVRELTSKPCAYCGDELLRKALDRIDNEVGHSRTNVVVACERCNYVRRDMPHAAWLVVAGAMRDARLRKLFGDWNGAIHRRDPLEAAPPLAPSTRTINPSHGTLGRYFKCGPPRCQACKDGMASWKRGRRPKISHR